MLRAAVPNPMASAAEQTPLRELVEEPVPIATQRWTSRNLCSEVTNP